MAPRRLRVLLLPQPGVPVRDGRSARHLAAVSARHDTAVYDRSRPAAPQFRGVEAVVDMGGNASRDLIDHAADAGVRYFQAQTNGLDHVEVEHILSRGITLAHCPGHLSAEALAQSAMMYLLLLAGRYKEAVANFAGGTYYEPEGRRLHGKLLAIIGYGASGFQLARRAHPFGMRLAAIDVRRIPQETLVQVPLEFCGGPEEMDDLLAECDAVSLHLHLHPGTRHIIDRRRIGLLKPSAWVINVARGALITIIPNSGLRGLSRRKTNAEVCRQPVAVQTHSATNFGIMLECYRPHSFLRRSSSFHAGVSSASPESACSRALRSISTSAEA